MPPRVAKNGKPGSISLPALGAGMFDLAQAADPGPDGGAGRPVAGERAVFTKPARGPKAETPDKKSRARFELALLGTEEFFLRPSQLGLLVRCPLRRVLEYLLAEDDEGGRPAQTGSLTHAAVAAFHQHQDKKLDRRVQAAMEALAANAALFPLADPDDARIFTKHYVADPRNREARLAAIERRVDLKLPPHPLDPTRKPIWVKGTLDQIRVHKDGTHHLYDLKTGAPSGAVMLGDYAYQCAAYCLAARASGFPNCETGYLIRAAAYRQQNARLPSPEGVFWKVPFDHRRAVMLMDSVRLTVALIRSGEVMVGPGVHCSYCPLGGLDGCLPVAESRLGLEVQNGS
jgi:RecB family exonuclease